MSKANNKTSQYIFASDLGTQISNIFFSYKLEY